MAGSASGQGESSPKPCDLPPERARLSYLAHSGLHVTRSLGIENITHKQSHMNFFFDFLVVLGKNAH